MLGGLFKHIVTADVGPYASVDRVVCPFRYRVSGPLEAVGILGTKVQPDRYQPTLEPWGPHVGWGWSGASCLDLVQSSWTVEYYDNKSFSIFNIFNKLIFVDKF